jgi:hypothetical protein
MKGISEWIWLIGGIMAAAIVFTIAVTLIQNTMNATIEKTSIQGYEEVVNTINDLCWKFEGNIRNYDFQLGETIEGVYATSDVKKIYESKELTKNIIDGEKSFGENLCIKVKGKRIRCEKLDCNATFPFVGSVPEKFSLSLLVNKLSGKGRIFDYYISFVRNVSTSGVEVFLGAVPVTTSTSTTSSSTVSATSTTSGQPPTPGSLVKLVDSNDMYNNIQQLAQQPRPYGSSWNSQTADYIKNKLESYGLDNVKFEDFSNGRNVVGEIGSGSNVIVVTGGHRDSVPNCLGAVDNAAGAATVMEAARVLAGYKDYIKTYKLRFVLFDNEENGLYGSIAYVNAHGSEVQRMINFDCIGETGNSGFDVYRTATDLSNSADRACSSLGLNCRKLGQGPCYSDHCSFGQKGIGYLWLTNYGSVCGTCYHCQQCQDDMDQIDRTRLEWAGKFAVYVLSDLYLK